jgi:dienelactone hydrolase
VLRGYQVSQLNRRSVVRGGLLALAGMAGVTACGRAVLGASPAPLPALAAQTTTARAVSALIPGQKLSGSFISAARRGVKVGWTVAYPAGAVGPLRVLIALHGRWATHTDTFDTGLHLDRVLAQQQATGTRPYAIASVDGGDTYWHPRAGGEDAGAMVINEFVPLLAGLGLDTSRIGLLGWSMGGYGALWLASLLGPQRVAAVAAESPALWLRAGDAAPGAFDGAADFSAHSVFARRVSLAGIPLRIDCGTSDPFYRPTRQYIAGLPNPPAGGFQPGGHDMDYWQSMAPAQVAFIGAHLP